MEADETPAPRLRIRVEPTPGNEPTLTRLEEMPDAPRPEVRPGLAAELAAATPFAELFPASARPNHLQMLAAAGYLTRALDRVFFTVRDLDTVLRRAGRAVCSMQSRAEVVKVGWLVRAGRGKYRLGPAGDAAWEVLARGGDPSPEALGA